MKNFHFALTGAVILLLIGSCSIEEAGFDYQPEPDISDVWRPPEETPVIEEPVTEGENETPPDEKTPEEETPPPDETTEPEKEPGEGEDEESTGKEPDDISHKAPALQINELRTEFQGSSNRAEYIEFKMLSAGNLGGLRVFAVSNKNPMIYEFEPAEVQAGEYVVLHLRTLEETCKDEYGGSLDESGGTDSSPTARDIWIPGSNKLLHKTDAVYVMDENGRVLDAVMITDMPNSEWNSQFAEAAAFLFSHGAWKSTTGTSPGPADAVDSSGIGQAMTRSISRTETKENTHTAADWYVTPNSGATPGRPNNP